MTPDPSGASCEPALAPAAVDAVTRGDSRPRLLDLFCCEGGAATGYAEAGFDVTGIDISPQPLYPYTFIQADALDYLRDHGSEYDAIHASPPCQDHSILTNRVEKHGTGHLLEDTLEALFWSGKPWIVENVEGAFMPGALTLCGTEFDISAVCKDGKRRWLKRHRLFSSNAPLWGAGGCSCRGKPIVGVYGRGGEGPTQNSYKAGVALSRTLIGCPWMSHAGASQAIPPAYTRHLGEQLMRVVREQQEEAA